MKNKTKYKIFHYVVYISIIPLLLWGIWAFFAPQRYVNDSLNKFCVNRGYDGWGSFDRTGRQDIAELTMSPDGMTVVYCWRFAWDNTSLSSVTQYQKFLANITYGRFGSMDNIQTDIAN